MIAITKRCLLLLQTICESEEPISTQRLADAMKVSMRTAQYDLALLTDWLKEQGVLLQKAPKKGFYLEEGARKQALQLLQEQNTSFQSKTRFLNSEERVCMIITDILGKRSDYTFDEAQERFGVSRATYMRDLDKADEWFANHGVELKRKQRRGVRIDVDEAVYRRLIVDFIQENSNQTALMLYCISHGKTKPEFRPSSFSYINRVLQEADLDAIISDMDAYLKKYGFYFTDEKYTWLIYYLAVMEKRVKEGNVLRDFMVTDQRLEKSREKDALEQMLRERFSEYLTEKELKQETRFLMFYILISSKNGKEQEIAANNETAERISLYFEKELDKRLGCGFSEDKELLRALKVHLHAAILRAELGLPERNAILDDIRIKFPDVFEVCTEIAKDMRDKFQIQLTQGEIGFITMYVALNVQRSSQQEKETRDIRATLICGYGVGTVTFLTDSLKKEFPQIEIVDKISIFDLDTYDFDDIDLIVTTIELPVVLNKPVIRVNPILRKIDIRRIDAFLRREKPEPWEADAYTQDIRVNELLDVIGKFCNIENEEKLTHELKKRIQVNRPGTGLPELPSFYDILPRKYVQARVKAESWEEAVKAASVPLLEDGCMTQEYVRKMLEVKEKYGQYSVISNGICMAHAEPDSGYRLACSLVTLEHPVEIDMDGTSMEIYVMMVLSLTDTVSQARALDELFLLLDEFPEFPFELQKAADTVEVFRLLRYYYNKSS